MNGRGTPVTEVANGYGMPVTKGAAGLPVVYETIGVAPPVVPLAPPLDAVANVTGAWSFSRNMLTSFGAGARYVKIGTAITDLKDQSGNARHLTDSATVSHRPAETTAFPKGILCADFDGANNWLNCPVAMSNFITSGSGAIVASVIVDAVTLNNVNPYDNHGIVADGGGYIGLYAKNVAGMTLFSFNYSTASNVATATGTVGTAYVMMWRHSGGNVYFSVNGGTEVVTVSGNTGDLSQLLYVGVGLSFKADMKLAELFITNNGGQTAALAAAIANMKTHCGA